MTAPVIDLPAHVAHFRWRVLQDALAQATAAYWLRRADELERARPRPTDYVGRATVAEIAAADHRLSEAARFCRHRAELAAEPLLPEVMTEAVDVLAGVA